MGSVRWFAGLFMRSPMRWFYGGSFKARLYALKG
jgi:hypothetical protein